MPTTSSATSSDEPDNDLRSDNWSTVEFAIAVRTYIFNERFPDAHAIHRIPQFSQGETRREAVRWLHRWVQDKVHEFRWEELRDYLWCYLNDRSWEWEQASGVAEMENFLSAVLDYYVRKHPRKYRTIDEE